MTCLARASQRPRNVRWPCSLITPPPPPTVDFGVATATNPGTAGLSVLTSNMSHRQPLQWVVPNPSGARSSDQQNIVTRKAIVEPRTSGAQSTDQPPIVTRARRNKPNDASANAATYSPGSPPALTVLEVKRGEFSFKAATGPNTTVRHTASTR